MLVAVTGTSGRLGSRVAARLADTGTAQVLLGRDTARMPDLPSAERRGGVEYADGPAVRAACDGVSTLVLVSGNLSGRRLSEHATVIDAARGAGVGRIVYVSLMGAAPDATYLNARDHWQTERYLAGTSMPHVVLRAGFYATMPTVYSVDGVLRGPAGDGRASLVTHDDLADAVVAAALDHSVTGTLDVTGPEALTLTEATTRIAAVTGRPLRFEHETPEDGFAWRSRLDATGPQIDGWISWYLAVASGQAAAVNDIVERLTGHPASPVEAAHR